MSTLRELLAQLEKTDPMLAGALSREVRALAQRREFGLNFERHTPEAVELPGRPVRKGDKVRVLPARDGNDKTDTRLWVVTRLTTSDGGERVAHLTAAVADKAGDRDTTTHLVADVVVVAEFRDTIYPGLKSTGTVEHGGDKPFHTVLNAENYHALQALLYTHAGRVDAIYIDPPYNTGAKDWKYNNDYVDGEDIYRHSKWLAFMERRLKLARRLLNPTNSVLIVTIDEREVHRLGLLLDQLFVGAKRQMVTIAINHRGVARNREFTRVEEYAFFVFLGEAGPTLSVDDLLSAESKSDASEPVRWERLIKGSNNARRVDRPRLFYPVFVDPKKRSIEGVGDAIELSEGRDTVRVPEGCVAVWPLSREGDEKRWQVSPATLRTHVANGTAKVGAYDAKNDRWSILYLNRGQLERIERGEIKVTGRDTNGVLELVSVTRPLRAAMTVWNRPSHNAGYYGSGVVNALLPGRKFPFPKSLYAVEDALRFAVGDKPDAVVVDFFAGSGTTAHAVMRLNRQDGGRRTTVSVTNNEVSADEQGALRAKGLRPGDDGWEEWGICDYITKPRIRAAIEGKTPDGDPVAGDYKFTDEFPMCEGFAENVEFFTLTYEAPRSVAHNRSFAAIAPLLWLKAGASGSRVESATGDYGFADTYAVLFDMDTEPPRRVRRLGLVAQPVGVSSFLAA